MAGHKRPSFLKKQKEQQRKAWATEKRAARQARRDSKGTGGTGAETLEEAGLEDVMPAEETASDEPAQEDVPHRQ